MENDADTPRVLCRKNVFSAGYVEIEFKRFANYSWDIIADGVSLGCPTTYASSLKNWTNFSIIALGMRDEGQMDWLNVTSNMLPPDSLEIYLNSPPNNTINNTVPYFYYNITNTGVNVSNCSLWTNQTGSWEARIYNATAVPNATNTYFGIGLPSDGDYLWNVQCIDTNSSEYWGDNNWTFIYDTNAPTYITNFVNNSVYYRNNLTAQFNLSDANLIHSYNISIDGINIQGNDSIDISNIEVNFTYNISYLAPGQHTLGLRVADGHTATKLLDSKAYNPTKGLLGDYIQFNFREPYKDGYIKIAAKDASLFDRWNYSEQTDKYLINFKPSKQTEDYIFTITADDHIHIVDAPDTKWKKWLIYKDQWLDFYPYENIEFKRIKDNIIEATIRGVSDSTLKFQSIGDLNILEVNYTFTTTNATMTYSNSVSEFETQTSTLNIIKTAYINYTNATFDWNGTSQNVTKIAFPTYDLYSTTFITPSVPNAITPINISWNYLIVSTDATNETGEILETQNVFKLLLDNCSIYNISVINFSLWEDNTTTRVVSDLKGYFEVWISDQTAYKPFNISWSGRNNYSLCINNESQTYNVYAQMEYQDAAETYAKETYYLYNITLSNETQLLNLYHTPGASLVTFTVTDENDHVIEGAYIHILKYDLPTDISYTTEILKTSSSGTDIGHIVLDTMWYKFFIYYNNELKLETAQTKISTLTKGFRIRLSEDYIESYTKIYGINTALTFNNATKTFAYVFTNPSGISKTMCLEVSRLGALENTIINTTCTTSASGVIYYTITEAVGSNTYLAKGYIQGSELGSIFLEASFDQGYQKWGKDGIFATVLLRIAVACIGIWSPIISIILLVLIDFLMVIFGLYKASMITYITYVILAIVVIWRLNRKT